MYLFKTDVLDTLVPHDENNPEARWVEVAEVSKLLTHPKDREFFLSVLPDLE